MAERRGGQQTGNDRSASQRTRIGKIIEWSREKLDGGDGNKRKDGLKSVEEESIGDDGDGRIDKERDND